MTVPGIGVDLDLAPGIPPVRADSVILRRVVENLVTNAAEALDGAGGRIGITTRLESNGDGRVVRIAIRDSGCGMSREELDRAFEDFYTTKPNGTGLGLSVVRRLVGDLGGTIRVETAPGQGSTFTVEIPAA